MNEKKSFDFLQEHSLRYLEMAFRTDRRGRLDKPDGYGRSTGECGDTVEIFLSLSDDVIESISYSTDGCLSTNACANAVAELAEGRDIESAWEIRPEKISEYLETLPAEHFHCAELSVGSFYLALSDAQRHKGDPDER